MFGFSIRVETSLEVPEEDTTAYTDSNFYISADKCMWDQSKMSTSIEKLPSTKSQNPSYICNTKPIG